MSKEEWEQALNEFEEIHSTISAQVNKYTKGSNKKIRSDAATDLRFSNHKVEYLLLKKYPETYNLFTGEEHAYHRAANLHESLLPHHIVDDLSILLIKIREKIKGLPENIQSTLVRDLVIIKY